MTSLLGRIFELTVIWSCKEQNAVQHVSFIRNPFIRNPFIRNQFIRNQFISNLVLDSLKFKKLLELNVFFYKKEVFKKLRLKLSRKS